MAHDDIVKAHADDWHAREFASHTWTGPDGVIDTFEGYPGAYDYFYRRCSYCGSIHPDDFIAAIDAGGVHLSRADMKYGYPHKVYAGIPNPIAGREGVVYSGRYDSGSFTPTYGTAPATVHTKFYTVHLLDMDPDRIEVLNTHFRRACGFEAFFDGDDMGFRIFGPSYVPGLVSEKKDDAGATSDG